MEVRGWITTLFPCYRIYRGAGKMEQANGRTFSIATFGCKLNQYESECLRHNLERRNWLYRRFEEGADFYIINSCTVTGKSDSRCRNAARKARRISPNATVIITGCYAEVQPDELRAMDVVDLVVDNKAKESIPVIMSRMIGEAESADHTESPGIESFHDHARAFIKIQEGCNASCTYCIIPTARGNSRSVPVAQVLDQVKVLADNNYNEIVLTGTHIGHYGNDLPDRTRLADLIERIMHETKGVRLRLSSIELNTITPRLIELITHTDLLASHLHIPLQSGDDDVLSAMRRPYTSRFFAETVVEIASTINGVAIGTDIIVGFPGESDECFDNTYRLLSKLPLTYFHVFRYSRRPGTPAASIRDQVHPELKKRRSKKLISLGKHKRYGFMKSQIGKKEIALVQGPHHRFSRFSTVLTGNYCEVQVKCSTSLSGRLLPVKISHYSRGRLYGSIEGTDGPGNCRTRESHI